MNLSDIISPVKPNDFFQQYFEKKPLLIQERNINYFDPILTVAQLNEYLTSYNIVYPLIRVVNRGVEIPLEDYTYSMSIGATTLGPLIDNEEIFGLFSEGGTIILQEFGKHCLSLKWLCESCEMAFQCPIHANIYITPPNSQGFTLHWDTHDVFVMQISGSKKWRVYNSPITLPSREIFILEEWQQVPPSIDVELCAGDLLYLPRGYIHEAETTGQHSVHIALALNLFTVGDLFERVLNQYNSELFRKSLPRDYYRETNKIVALENQVKEELKIWIEQLNFTEAAGKLHQYFTRHFLDKHSLSSFDISSELNQNTK